MLPNALLQAGVNHRVLVELKSGDTYFGLLVKIDRYMNLHLRDAMCHVTTSSSEINDDTENMVRLPDVYVRGNAVKGFVLPEAVADMVLFYLIRLRSF